MLKELNCCTDQT